MNEFVQYTEPSREGTVFETNGDRIDLQLKSDNVVSMKEYLARKAVQEATEPQPMAEVLPSDEAKVIRMADRSRRIPSVRRTAA